MMIKSFEFILSKMRPCEVYMTRYILKSIAWTSEMTSYLYGRELVMVFLDLLEFYRSDGMKGTKELIKRYEFISKVKRVFEESLKPSLIYVKMESKIYLWYNLHRSEQKTIIRVEKGIHLVREITMS